MGSGGGTDSDRERKTGHLGAVIENLPVILFTIDPDGTFTMSRGKALESIGLEPGEAIGSTIEELYGEQPDILAEFEQALAGEEVRYTATVGGRVFETWLQPITDDDGAVREVLGLSQDITDQKTYEQELEENDAILQQLTETTDDVFWLFDSDFTELQFINQAYEDVWGLSTAELRENAMSFLDGVHPEDRGLIQETMGRLQAGESTMETYRVNPNEEFSRYVSVRGEPIQDDDGTVIRAAGYARDITERKERERQLRRLSEATQQLPLAKTPDDVAEKVLQIAEDVLGCGLTALWRYESATDELVPWTVTDEVLSFGEYDDSADLVTIQPGDFEMEVFQDGDVVSVAEYSELENPANPESDVGGIVMAPIGDQALVLLGSVEPGTFSQSEENLVTILANNANTAFQRAEREQELEAYKNKLEESNKNLQEFAYIASHDLQEPLRSVTSYLDLLETEYSDVLDEDAEFYIERASSNASRMSKMVDALLEYSRVKTDAGEFDAVDVETLVSETVESLEMLIRETDAEISVENLPRVAGDENQLGQVFQNLLKNAIEHGGEPPEVVLRADAGDSSAEMVTFAVSDNGAGIPENQYDRIFEIFQQGEKDSGNDGTGIGLAICERIVTRHDGEIWVESAESGSTFKFTLPKVTDT